MTRRLLLAFLALLIGSVTVVRYVARALVFPAAHVAVLPTPEGFVRHALVASDGVPVDALELAGAVGARTLVHFHGNRESAASCADLARALHARGLGVLLVEYRGYGALRDASPTEDGVYRDAEAALDMLARRGIGAERIVLWGTSLGTGVAAEMALRRRGAGLVLVTPYTSIPGLVTDVVPLAPARLLLPDHFDTLAKSGGIAARTLVIHGDADEIVPFWMGERVSGAIHGARFVRVPGAHHGDLFARDGAHLLAEIAALGS